MLIGLKIIVKNAIILDVLILPMLYVTTLNAKGGFITKNFIKSTAKDQCFLNGVLHHLTSGQKLLVFGKAVEVHPLMKVNPIS